MKIIDHTPKQDLNLLIIRNVGIGSQFKVIPSDIILAVYQAEVLGQKDRTIGSLGVLYFKDKALPFWLYKQNCKNISS